MRKNLLIMVGVIMLISSCRKNNNDIIPANNQQSGPKIAGRSSTPFTGSMYYTSSTTHDLPCDCGSYYVLGTFDGRGVLSHLGASTSLIKPAVSPISSGGFRVQVECAIFIAANGDTLKCYTHPYDLIPDPSISASTGIVNVDFAGGSGRFAGATGSFTGTITVPFGPGGTASLTGITGTLNY